MPAVQVLKNIRRQPRRQYSAEEKIRIVLEGLRVEENISELCRREGIAASMYYGWSKEFLETGKRRLAGDAARAANSNICFTAKRSDRLSLEIDTEVQPFDKHLSSYSWSFYPAFEQRRPIRVGGLACDTIHGLIGSYLTAADDMRLPFEMRQGGKITMRQDNPHRSRSRYSAWGRLF